MDTAKAIVEIGSKLNGTKEVADIAQWSLEQSMQFYIASGGKLDLSPDDAAGALRSFLFVRARPEFASHLDIMTPSALLWLSQHKRSRSQLAGALAIAAMGYELNEATLAAGRLALGRWPLVPSDRLGWVRNRIVVLKGRPYLTADDVGDITSLTRDEVVDLLRGTNNLKLIGVQEQSALRAAHPFLSEIIWKQRDLPLVNKRGLVVASLQAVGSNEDDASMAELIKALAL